MAYSVADDVRTVFGAVSVNSWADLDGDGSGVSARIDAAIEEADAHIDAHIGFMTTVPLSTVPTLIKWLSARKAGTILYSNRGHIDVDQQSGEELDKLTAMRREVERTLTNIRTGRIMISGVTPDTSPGVVSIDTPTSTDRESRGFDNA